MRIVVIGEAMLEYKAHSPASGLAYGGDTLNTAIHLARIGHHVQYISALGRDPISAALRQTWRNEGIDTQYVLVHPSRQPGIYAIHNDETGERSFLYWRNQSAAKDMFSLPDIDTALAALKDADLFYYSLITLAILPDEARHRLLQATRDFVAQGGRFAFDGNYRPTLWDSHDQAVGFCQAAAAIATIGLPTSSDECLMHSKVLSAEDVAQIWLHSGTKELAVKTGPDGCLVATAESRENILPPPQATVVDSSGAGDAFNAGYLAARLAGQDEKQAASQGHLMARWVIERPGAIPAQDDAAPYKLWKLS